MGTFQEVGTKISELGSWTAGGISRAAASLVETATKKAGQLSFDQMHERLNAAVKALRGDEAKKVDASNTLKLPLKSAQAFFKSYGVPIVFLGCISPVEASIVFNGDARFSGNVGPQMSGFGTLTIERVPIGSGISLAGPENLDAGITTGRGYVISYVASAADLGSSVFINWVAVREYSSSGGRGWSSVRAGLKFELVNHQGEAAGVYYVASTDASVLTGAGGVWVSEGGTFLLTPEKPVKVVTERKAAIFGIPVTSQDWMTSGLLLSLKPTRANQEFRITLSPDLGVTSLIEDERSATVVPEPPSIVGGLGVLAAVGLAAARRRCEYR